MDDEVREPDEVLEVGAFYQLLTAQLESAFGRRHPHWVRGEIAKVYEKGHVYVDLVDAGSTSSDTKRPVLNAHCWATQWALLEANKQIAVSPVPLRVGLLASPGTEGYSDFTGQLLHSGYGFQIILVKSAVQGDAAPAQIVAAIGTLERHGVDIICVVRGGGSKGDLACFDDERVARAIAASSTPVFTGIDRRPRCAYASYYAHQTRRGDRRDRRGLARSSRARSGAASA